MLERLKFLLSITPFALTAEEIAFIVGANKTVTISNLRKLDEEDYLYLKHGFYKASYKLIKEFNRE